MAGATFTISSLGGIGGTSFTPIVNAPEVAILGVTRSRDEAGVERVGVRAAADGAAVAVLRPPRDRRRARGALRRAPGERARPTCGGWCSDGGQGPRHRRLHRRPRHRGARRARRRGRRRRRRWSSWSPTRRRWRSRRRPPARSRTIDVKVGDKVSEGSVLMTLETAARGRRRSRRSRRRRPRRRAGRRRAGPGGRARRRPGRLHGGVPRRRPRARASRWSTAASSSAACA